MRKCRSLSAKSPRVLTKGGCWDSVSLDIKGGEIVCLLGPSGAGKTTLIRLIMGAIKADGGEIFIDDIRVPSMKLFDKIGFMPQNDALYNDLSGLDNLLFFGGPIQNEKTCAGGPWTYSACLA